MRASAGAGTTREMTGPLNHLRNQVHVFETLPWCPQNLWKQHEYNQHHGELVQNRQATCYPVFRIQNAAAIRSKRWSISDTLKIFPAIAEVLTESVPITIQALDSWSTAIVRQTSSQILHWFRGDHKVLLLFLTSSSVQAATSSVTSSSPECCWVRDRACFLFEVL